MGFIYYIYSTHNKETLYIGQDSRDDYFDPNNRIFEHARIAYGLKDGPYKGSEAIMRENSLSEVSIHQIAIQFTLLDGRGEGSAFPLLLKTGLLKFAGTQVYVE